MAQSQTPQNVAESATQSAKIPNRGPLLLGIFGTESAPEALIRLPGGRTETVAVGDRVQGQQVVAIDATRIALARGGAAQWLELPATR
ncbi:pilus assembly protein PilP [Salipiger sp. P9]|uniref:pilus assembly protein PilP n=1 Tax=Salipiger pentaromativorans TaxID=2943193 RepID=UPI002157E173|nr:pilus assembly protein PilP [Salipiger pentaromativorans]MCR8550196.1 pilus assembly protein PilP [Salipiger pentaromativorans]